MKNIIWELKVFNPLNDELLMDKTFTSLKEVSENFTKIPFNTWRNISIGRCKIYDKFLTLEKKNKTI
tara:strand:+ start:16026 stop:16226 length:201 start_codon:yes stop_codon:yes gene_type:complete